MRRAHAIAIRAALAACVAAPALASFRIRVPRRLPHFVSRRADASAIPAFPEGSLVSTYAIHNSNASFALYWCGLQPDAALKAATAALEAAGWIRVSVFGSIVLFENEAGACAAAQALPARGGASEVSFLVRR